MQPDSLRLPDGDALDALACALLGSVSFSDDPPTGDAARAFVRYFKNEVKHRDPHTSAHLENEWRGFPEAAANAEAEAQDMAPEGGAAFTAARQDAFWNAVERGMPHAPFVVALVHAARGTLHRCALAAESETERTREILTTIRTKAAAHLDALPHLPPGLSLDEHRAAGFAAAEQAAGRGLDVADGLRARLDDAEAVRGKLANVLCTFDADQRCIYPDTAAALDDAHRAAGACVDALRARRDGARAFLDVATLGLPRPAWAPAAPASTIATIPQATATASTTRPASAAASPERKAVPNANARAYWLAVLDLRGKPDAEFRDGTAYGRNLSRRANRHGARDKDGKAVGDRAALTWLQRNGHLREPDGQEATAGAWPRYRPQLEAFAERLHAAGLLDDPDGLDA